MELAFASPDVFTEYDYCEMLRNRIRRRSDIWSLPVIDRYGHNMTVYLWAFKMMHRVIRQRFISLIRSGVNGQHRWPLEVVEVLSAFHLGTELNGDSEVDDDPNRVWDDEELTYYAMLHIFDLRSDWKSWIATKILPGLSEKNLNLIKRITSNAVCPEVAKTWNSKFVSQIYNIDTAHFMQYVFVFGGNLSVQSMRLLLAMNSNNLNNVHYLLSFTNFNHHTTFWSLWSETSLFLGLLNNDNVSNDVIELILLKMQRHYDGVHSERVLNKCCIEQFVQIDGFKKEDIIWKRLLWILLPKSKYAKKDPFRSLNVHRYGIPTLCRKLDTVKLRWFLSANLLDPKALFTDANVRRLCAKDESDADYEQAMRFLVVLFDWITVKCKREPQIQRDMARYKAIADKYR